MPQLAGMYLRCGKKDSRRQRTFGRLRCRMNQIPFSRMEKEDFMLSVMNTEAIRQQLCTFAT